MTCYDDLGGVRTRRVRRKGKKEEGRKEGGQHRQENKNPTLRMWGKRRKTHAMMTSYADMLRRLRRYDDMLRRHVMMTCYDDLLG